MQKTKKEIAVVNLKISARYRTDRFDFVEAYVTPNRSVMLRFRDKENECNNFVTFEPKIVIGSQGDASLQYQILEDNR